MLPEPNKRGAACQAARQANRAAARCSIRFGNPTLLGANIRFESLVDMAA